MSMRILVGRGVVVGGEKEGGREVRFHEGAEVLR